MVTAPIEKSAFSQEYVCPVDWMFVLASCILSWSVLEKHLVSHPPALSRLHGDSVCTCHYDIPSSISTLFSHYNFYVYSLSYMDYRCLLFRTVGDLSPGLILGVPPPVNEYFLALIKALVCSGLVLFITFPKDHIKAYLSNYGSLKSLR